MLLKNLIGFWGIIKRHLVRHKAVELVLVIDENLEGLTKDRPGGRTTHVDALKVYN